MIEIKLYTKLTAPYTPEGTTSGNISALALAKNGLNKQELVSILTNAWQLLPEDMHAANVTEYFARYWTGSYLYAKVRNGTLSPNNSGIIYSIIWRCKPKEAYQAHQVKISFRASALGNFALISTVALNLTSSKEER